MSFAIKSRKEPHVAVGHHAPKNFKEGVLFGTMRFRISGMDPRSL